MAEQAARGLCPALWIWLPVHPVSSTDIAPPNHIPSTSAHSRHLSQLSHINELTLKSQIGTNKITRLNLLGDEKLKARHGPSISGV